MPTLDHPADVSPAITVIYANFSLSWPNLSHFCSIYVNVSPPASICLLPPFPMSMLVLPANFSLLFFANISPPADICPNLFFGVSPIA